MNEKEPSRMPQILSYFKFDHLPVNLQPTSKAFHDMAVTLVYHLADSSEREMALRKLLEAKDCAVRAALQK